MKYTVISSAEYAYPDRFEYESSKDYADICGVKGGYASFQVVLSDVESENIPVVCEGFDAELYSLYPIVVERNFMLDNTRTEHCPVREAPYMVYDALMPYRGKLKVSEDTKAAGLYVAIHFAKDAQVGVFSGKLKVGGLEIPVKYEIFDVVLPEESLRIIQGYSRNFEQYHGAKRGSPEFKRLDDEYFAMLRRMHQNMMYVGGVEWKEVAPNKYEFDFSRLEREIETGLAHGIKYFDGPSVGWRKSWHESTIFVRGDIPSMSYEGYCYLSQYLPALHDMLQRRGWLDIFMMGVADEPNNENCTEFRALCGLIHRIVPDIKLIDAMSYGNLHGALDVWVPLNSEYSVHREQLETLRSNGAEIWQYVCCAPRWEGYINRFMDYALLCTRMMFWGNYKFNLTGYLHWATNNFQNGISTYNPGTEYHQDPFTNNVPEHHNTDSVTYLSAGDTHLIYPGGYNGNGDIQEPWPSIRLENQRESAEEYELFKLLASYDKAKADSICEKCFRDFNDIEYSVNIFDQTRRELFTALANR